MGKRRLIWKVTPWYMLIVGLCTVAMAWFAGHTLRQYDEQRIRQTLIHDINLIAAPIQQALDQGETTNLKELCKQFKIAAEARLTVIDLNGRVLGDSDELPELMSNHANRPEFVDVVKRGRESGHSRRYSQTVGQYMVYVAIAIRQNDQARCVVRASMPMVAIEGALQKVYRRIFLGGLVMAGMAFVVTLVMFSRQVVKPLKQLQNGAERFAGGGLEHTLEPADSVEFDELTNVLNTMANQLDEKIKTTINQSHEQQAILASMVEGVLAVDHDERVISMNEAAAKLLDNTVELSIGRSLIEVTRNLELRDFVLRTLNSNDPIEGELSLNQPSGQRLCQVYGSQLHHTQKQQRGAVIVLHDQTQLKQLERIRQEFVANVSHELKTPIAAIKASIETLLNERDDDDDRPVWRFAHTIERQAERLGAIVEDLLSLARLEQDNKQGQIEMSPGEIQPIIDAAVETCQASAAIKGVRFHMDVKADIDASVNPPLLEQALVNLLANAIKFSDDETLIDIRAYQSDSEVVIEVIDRGIGIDQAHLSRLFERFYRTDKARSRAMGGTGLGLAIVKHVANVHGGKVSVESIAQPDPAHGSTFRIHLPR